MIYFVQFHKTGHIKIGHTNQIWARVKSLKSFYGSFDILGVMDGDTSTEKSLHNHFSHLNLPLLRRGRPFRASELFQPEQELLAYIRANTHKNYDLGFPYTLRMYMSAETRRKLRKLAADRDISVNDVLRQAAQKTFDSEGLDIDLSDGLDTWGGKRVGKDEDED